MVLLGLNNMNWYSRLYVGRNAQSNKHRIISKIKKNKPQMGIYVLTLPANNENVLDIYPANTLLQPHYRQSDILVVGIAKGRSEAMELMTQIVMEAYEFTGSYKVRNLVEKYS